MYAAECLGNVVRQVRQKLGYTQNDVAEMVGVEVRTIMHIENGIGNPTWEVVFPLIRNLNIDPRTIFYPELNRNDEALSQMQILLAQCNEKDIDDLIPIFNAVISVLRSRDNIAITDK
jgi:DNA-binding XRE family transcriptional regulator